jgi:hypothetical protein
MASYLLLRDNKESGPFSLDDLQRLGFKPYDLVWVEGKSAAWRYPGELPELKPFAPIVEEQPFDRFYKKPTEQKADSTPINYEQPHQDFVAETPTPTHIYAGFTKEEEKYLPKPNIEEVTPLATKKSVFVTLPGNAKKVLVDRPKQVQPEKQATFESKEQFQPKQKVTENSSVSSASQVAAQETVDSRTIVVTENPETAKIKYSQPLDEIKEMYVKTLQDRKHKIARKSLWLKYLKVAATVLALIAVGVVVGLGMKKSDTPGNIATVQPVPSEFQQLPVDSSIAANNDNQASIENDEAASQRSTSKDITEENPVTDANADKQRLVSDQPVSEKMQAQPQQQNERPVTTKDNKETTSLSKNASDFLKESDEYYPGAETNPSTGERNKQKRSDAAAMLAENKPVFKEDKKFVSKPSSALADQVEVSSNNYQRVAFGGIRNLQLTIKNDSKYALDNVMVELLYLRPNELPLKTDNIVFRGIAPHGTSTIKIPDTNRGIKVTYKIIHIESKQLTDDVANR